jgi:general secretion pathway protein D
LTTVSDDSGQIDKNQLNSVLGQSTMTYITINEEHNLLVVKTSDADMLKSIAKLVKKLDKPQIQVMLEMKIVDIKVGEDFDSIFNIELTNTGITGKSTNPIILGGAALTGGGSLVYEFIDQHIKANIEMLEKNNRLNIIANPMIVASNHRPATLFVGEERIMVRGYSIDTIDNLNTTRTITTPETELKEIGTRLEITPHINNDGSIHIVLQQESATLNKKSASIPVTDGSGSVLELPVDTVSTARLEGEIFARHGYTVAVGGLIRDSFSRDRRKVPYLADVPIIGNVFRSTQDEDSRSEMVLLITPYILTHDNQKTVDPTQKYHRHAEDLAFKAKAIPELQQKIPEPVCGQYCAPVNMRQSDL